MLGLENDVFFFFQKKRHACLPATLKGRARNNRQSGKLIVLGVVHFFSRKFVTSVSAILVSPPLRPGLHLEAPTLGGRNRNARRSGKLEVVGLVVTSKAINFVFGAFAQVPPAVIISKGVPYRTLRSHAR